jgi:chemotaxis protein MotB
MVRGFIAGLGGVLLVAASGCVGHTAYQKKVDEASDLSRDLTQVQRKNLELVHDNEGLRAEITGLRSKVVELSEARKRLEQMLSTKPEKVYERMAELEREKVGLKEDLANAEKSRGAKVSEARMVYESLLELLKADVAAGRVTVNELHGLITVAPVNDALFEAESAVIHAGGARMLRKAAEFLKGIRAGEIQASTGLEMSTETKAPDRSPSTWNLAMMRVNAVTVFLNSSGIDPAVLRAVIRGDFRAGGGKSGSRRIEISIKMKE